MKLIVTPAEMQEIDRKTIHDRDVAGETLMDLAGRAVFETIFKRFPDLSEKSIVVFCGKGNNGGDGLVLANYLVAAGAKPQVYLFCKEDELKHDLRVYFNKIVASGIQPTFIGTDVLLLPVQAPDITVDALLGTGSRSGLSDPYVKAVEALNEWVARGTYMVSVDIPSGLNGETGMAMEAAVLAHATVTMGLPKSGLVFGDGKQYTGELIVADVGFPEDLVNQGDRWLIDEADIRLHLPRRRHNSHKYDFGKVLVIGGSKGMSGAALMTAKAAMRMGCGLLKAAVPKSIAHVIEQGLPEAMTIAVQETDSGSISPHCMDALIEWCDWADVVALGPGLSRNEETFPIVAELLKRVERRMVIDADALVVLEGDAALLRAYKSEIVLTPHAGELAYLTGAPKQKIKADPAGVLASFVRDIQKTVLLKGSPTRIASPNGHLHVVNKGNPGMATAGSGDVLTGIIAGLMAQGLSSDAAAYCGVFLHGYAGDMAKDEMTEMGLIAGDLIDYLPRALRKILY